MGTLVTVARFSFPHEANIAKGLLESEGIPSFVADEHTVNMQWLYSNAMGGVRLQVPCEFSVSALDILKEDFSDSVNSEFDMPIEKCPQCESLDVENYTKGKRSAFLVFIFLGFPLFFYKHGLRCKKCEYFWKK